MAVNELIIKKTCAGPKRFRPKTREELQLDCEKHTKENARLLKQVKALKTKLDSVPPVPGAGPATDVDAIAPNSTALPGPIGLTSAPSPQMPLLSPVGKEEEMLQEIVELKNQVQTFRNKIKASDIQSIEQMREIQELVGCVCGFVLVFMCIVHPPHDHYEQPTSCLTF